MPKTQSTTFGASDTNYVELSPVWEAPNIAYRFSNPQDITIGPDGMIFVADKGNNRVVALSKAGQVLSSGGLGNIIVDHPTGVAVDSKLNLLIANGTNVIYCWNQYLNLTDIESVSDRAVYFDRTTNDTLLLTLDDVFEKAAAGEALPEFRYFVFSEAQDKIQQVRQIYPIYIDDEADAVINGVAAGRYGSEDVYITESNYHRISHLKLFPRMAVKTRFGQTLFSYRAAKMDDLATFGSGAGTVDDPYAITTDSEGSIYFTQLGGNFRVQKLKAPDFAPGYVLYQHAIMDLNRFSAPKDIALDGLNNIFVIDEVLGTVSKFDNAGTGAGQLVDLGKKGLATATFNKGAGIMVSDNVVYVVESGLNRIRRFQLSISDADIPDDDKKP